MTMDLDGKKGSPATLNSDSQSDLEKIPHIGTIIERALRQAEGEASQIIEQAKAEAQSIMDKPRQAVEATRLEGETILQLAHARAAMVESDSLKSKLMLVEIRDRLEAEIREEGKDPDYWLLTALQSLIAWGQNDEERSQNHTEPRQAHSNESAAVESPNVGTTVEQTVTEAPKEEREMGMSTEDNVRSSETESQSPLEEAFSD